MWGSISWALVSASRHCRGMATSISAILCSTPLPIPSYSAKISASSVLVYNHVCIDRVGPASQMARSICKCQPSCRPPVLRTVGSIWVSDSLCAWCSMNKQGTHGSPNPQKSLHKRRCIDKRKRGLRENVAYSSSPYMVIPGTLSRNGGLNSI